MSSDLDVVMPVRRNDTVGSFLREVSRRQGQDLHILCLVVDEKDRTCSRLDDEAHIINILTTGDYVVPMTAGAYVEAMVSAAVERTGARAMVSAAVSGRPVAGRAKGRPVAGGAKAKASRGHQTDTLGTRSTMVAEIFGNVFLCICLDGLL